MPVSKKAIYPIRRFDLPISYKLLDEDKLFDALNIYDNKGTQETRPGTIRLNTTVLASRPLSLSFFKDKSSNRYRLAKVGTLLQTVAVGGGTSIKTGLTSTTKHRGVTVNNRHIMAIEADGLFQWNGTTFTQLGQAVPAAPVIALSNATGVAPLLANAIMEVAYTFYDSVNGFETNLGAVSNRVTPDGTDDGIDVTGMATTALNSNIDKKRIYIRNVTANGSWLFVAEIALATASYDLDSATRSLITPPTAHATPPTSGKYISTFGQAIAVSGVTGFESEIFISEDYIPDAFNDGVRQGTTPARTIVVPGEGPITGHAEGLYNGEAPSPFLAGFKKNSTIIYSEVGGVKQQDTLSKNIGCVSHDTIRVENGVVYFLSENGWYRIRNGKLEESGDIKQVVPLGEGDIQDIFTREGWVNQLNKTQFSSFFSVIYTTLNQYITFIATGANSSIYEAYVYERSVGGFRKYRFKVNFTCATEGEDDSGNQVIYLGDDTGTIFVHSIKNDTHDENAAGTSQSIETFIILPWLNHFDQMSTVNFKHLSIKGLASANAITLRTFKNYVIQGPTLNSIIFTDPGSGFTLDEDRLDEAILGDDRVPVQVNVDINETALNLLAGFYQDIIDANIGLINGQMHAKKNGNWNT